ncbi:MAG: polyprenyl synthetase family protein [Desulfobacteraceae bacterium]|nr:MAG: polyprenyl synthetase family protein [Desulfobacteraceae bacterium]
MSNPSSTSSGSSGSTSFDLPRFLADQRNIINKSLAGIIEREFDDSRLCRAMSYSLMAPGKRLRPILCLAAAETVECSDIRSDIGFPPFHDAMVTAACAIEMVHTYSLIHDDLPAMDNDELRRGQPTCHVKFDEATAILAGDALLTLAFETLSSQRVLAAVVQPDILLQIIGILSRAAGYKGMIEGQVQDMIAEGKTLDLESLKRMHSLKTGALISASITIGALLGGATPDQIRHLDTYARHIGLAFQVADDILNVEGDPDKMGKSVRTDRDRNKSTFPGIIGLEPSKRFADELINNALQAIKVFGTKADALSALASYVISRKR